MIYGAHALIYSRAPEEARSLLATILGPTDTVDAGGGWLIFALPPSEIAVHPTHDAPGIDLYLMCQDIEKTIVALREKGVKFTKPVQDVSWGRVCAIALPGGGELGLYQPRHASPVARPSASKEGRKPRAASNGGARASRAAASRGRSSR